jgi:hypothetical protein
MFIRPITVKKNGKRHGCWALVCFIAYVVWKTLGQMCKAAGLGDEPRRVFEELANIKAVDVVLPIRSGGHIRRRCVSQPSDYPAILLQRLGLNLPKNLPPTNKILKKNVVKTFSVFKPKSTIYTLNCGTWAKISITQYALKYP